MTALAAELGWTEVDGVVMDIGISSMQLDTPVRGFSYVRDGPLDMRMNRRSRTTASKILNRASADEIADILRRYGELRSARRLAGAIVERAKSRPWERTEELAELTSMREFRKQTMPAKERYQLLLEEYPELVQRVPDNQLAAWLGVVPATFSRLKNAKTGK